VSTRIEELGAPPSASQPASLSSTAPVFASAPVSQPSEGPAAGGTAITTDGANFPSSPQLRFGGMNPVSAIAAGTAQLQATSPASVANSPVSVTAYFTNGWLALAPPAFSYGPKIVRVLLNTGSALGGDTVTIYGYGFGSTPGNVTATIGGQSATIVSVDALSTVSTALGLDNSFPFPLERIVLRAPSGSAGKADVTVTSASGSTTGTKAFQYVTSSQTYANAALRKFILYDSSRQQLDLTATDHVDVFDLATQAFLSPLEPPPNGPPPDAGLRGAALTPDHTQLLVADFGAQSVYLINPDGAAYNGTAVNVGGVAGFSASGPARVTATNAQTVFVSLSGEGNSTGSCSPIPPATPPISPTPALPAVPSAFGTPPHPTRFRFPLRRTWLQT
jgi:IPT/TIG domain